MLLLSDCPKSPVPAPLAVMDIFLEYPYRHISDTSCSSNGHTITNGLIE